MGVSEIGSMSTALSSAQTGDAVAVSVLKKALEVEGQGALQLVLSATQTAANNPPHLGQSVDVKA